jgi:hypothetical protein
LPTGTFDAGLAFAIRGGDLVEEAKQIHIFIPEQCSRKDASSLPKMPKGSSLGRERRVTSATEIQVPEVKQVEGCGRRYMANTELEREREEKERRQTIEKRSECRRQGRGC